jgi:hypothetical protein
MQHTHTSDSDSENQQKINKRIEIAHGEMVPMSLKMVNLVKAGRSISFPFATYHYCQYLLSLVTFSIAGILFLVAQKCLC